MASLPRRTGVTELTDDEVLLFDFLFDASVAERMLRRDAYSIHMNVSYTHSLNDQNLHQALSRLAQQGLIAADTMNGSIYWRLTPTGGARWELERQPRWEVFCRDSESIRRSGRPLLTVMSPEKATAEKFWYIGVKTHLWNARGKQPRYWQIHNHELIPWRRFSAIHVLAARVEDNGREPTDWQEYEAGRTWWRTISELDTLQTRVK